MNLFLTNLQNSKRIKELGVGCKSTFRYVKHKDGSIAIRYSQVGFLMRFQWEIPAYTLDQLYPVLREIGNIKGWAPLHPDGTECISKYDPIDYTRLAYIHHFRRICELAPTDPEAAQNYLSKLLS